jgi:hypothetical protein
VGHLRHLHRSGREPVRVVEPLASSRSFANFRNT